MKVDLGSFSKFGFSRDVPLFRTDTARVAKMYGLDADDITIRYSARLRTANGILTVNKLTKKFEIKLNPRARKEFGADRMLGTLRHELAHWVAYLRTGYLSHDNIFKKICVEVGGTMNRKFATGQFASAASSDFLKTPYRYSYTCPKCGAQTKKKQRIARKMIARYSCRKCHTMLSEFVEKRIA
jgi:predicted SprT family Zn-dependent metalloprotease